MRKAVRTLARMCDVPYHRQPLTPQLRHHMAASVAQLVEHRSRKAGVTGSSPVAGSIAQDSRLRAAFLLLILSAHAPTQASPRRQLPYSKTETPPNVIPLGETLLAGFLRDFPRGITPSDEQLRRTACYSSQQASASSLKQIFLTGCAPSPGNSSVGMWGSPATNSANLSSARSPAIEASESTRS